MVHVRSHGYRYHELIEWFESKGLETREEATRLMLILNQQNGIKGLLLGQQRALDEYYGPKEERARREREEFIKSSIGEKREVPTKPNKRFELFEDKRGRTLKRNIKTGRFVKLSKSDKRRLAKGKR